MSPPAALTFPTIVPATALGRGGAVPPSERIVIGAIGVGGRGTFVLGWMLGEPDVQCVAVCDVRRAHADRAQQLVNSRSGANSCAVYRDLRTLLAERSDLDAVLIAQGQALVATANRCGRVFQTGAQRASEPNFIVAGELLRQGRLGQVHTVQAHLGYLPEWPRRNAVLPPQPEPPKDVFDWDLWLGPSPWRPYNEAFLGQYPAPGWYTQYDFAGGIPQWGSHTILQCQLDLGLADSSPVAYEFPADLTGQGMTARFANGVSLHATCDGWRGSCGVKYIGSEGWVAVADGYEKPDVSSPLLLRDFQKLLHAYTSRTQRPTNHVRDFLNCVRSRRQPVTNALVAHRTMTTNLIMDICLDLRRNLLWNPLTEQFTDDPQANRLRSRASRPPWQA